MSLNSAHRFFYGQYGTLIYFIGDIQFLLLLLFLPHHIIEERINNMLYNYGSFYHNPAF